MSEVVSRNGWRSLVQDPKHRTVLLDTTSGISVRVKLHYGGYRATFTHDPNAPTSERWHCAVFSATAGRIIFEHLGRTHYENAEALRRVGLNSQGRREWPGRTIRRRGRRGSDFGPTWLAASRRTSSGFGAWE